VLIALAAPSSGSRADADANTDDRIPIALSSETAVSRWFGIEILDHSKGAIDLSRCEGGLPLLLGHEEKDHIGVIEDVVIGSDRVARGLMRFSRSPRAQEIRQDVLDGIRTRASIGYRIREFVLEKQDKTGDTYRATDWELLEGSIVAVPADISVGVGRSADEAAFPVRIRTLDSAPAAKEHTVDTKDTAAPNGATTNTPAVDVGATRELGGAPGHPATDQRAADLAGLAKQYNAHGELAGWIANGRSVDDAKNELLQRMAANAKPMLGNVVELNDKEQRRYSVVRALNAQVARTLGEKHEDDGFEREISTEIEKKLPNNYRRQGGILVPTNLRHVKGMEHVAQRALDSFTATKGAELVFKEQGEFIDLLRARMRLRQLGARTLSGLVSPLLFPRQTGTGTFSWVGENPNADVADSDLLLSLVALDPKTGQSSTSFSRQALAMTQNPDIEQLVREDIATVHALGIDAAGITGTGAANQPTGILNTAGIGAPVIGVNGGVPSWAKVVELETAVATANADVDSMGYLTTPGVRGYMKANVKFAGTAATLWGDGASPVNGYRAEVSTQVPSNLTKGTSNGVCHAMIFGDFSQIVIGEWGALEMIVDPLRLKKRGMVEVTSFQMVGMAIRQPAALAALRDITI